MNSSLEKLEVWKPIDGTDGQYEVSTHGRVRSLKRGRETILVGDVTNKGYRRVIFRMGDRWVKRSIHRLVLEAFVGPCPDGYEGAHEDGVKTHNWLSNLSWKTRPDNHADKRRHGTAQRGENHGATKITEGQARQAKQLLAEGLTAVETARRIGTTPHIVYHISHGTTWKHLGEVK